MLQKYSLHKILPAFHFPAMKALLPSSHDHLGNSYTHEIFATKHDGHLLIASHFVLASNIMKYIAASLNQEFIY